MQSMPINQVLSGTMGNSITSIALFRQILIDILVKLKTKKSGVLLLHFPEKRISLQKFTLTYWVVAGIINNVAFLNC